MRVIKKRGPKRTFTSDYKKQVLDEIGQEPEYGRIALIARKHDIDQNVIQSWRRLAKELKNDNSTITDQTR